MLRRLVLTALVGACGAPHAAVPRDPAPAGARLPVGPPLVTPGEHMSYELALRGIRLAVFDLAVGKVTELGGKRVIVVQSHARTVGLGSLVKVDDYFASWIDVTTGRPLRWTSNEFSTNGKHREKTTAELAKRTGDVVPIEFHLDDDPPHPEPQHVSLPDVWDYDSFLVALRSWEGPPGTSVVAEVLRSRYLWHVQITIHGKQMLSTALGALPALRLDGHTYKLRRDGHRAPNSAARDFQLWISDDDGRVPLQIVARTDYGPIKMRIVDYQPGTGKRLRD